MWGVEKFHIIYRHIFKSIILKQWTKLLEQIVGYLVNKYMFEKSSLRATDELGNLEVFIEIFRIWTWHTRILPGF
jgi:hypothetical protein